MRKITNLFFLFLLVFIGFLSGRVAVSTHIDSDVTMSDSNLTVRNFRAVRLNNQGCVVLPFLQPVCVCNLFVFVALQLSVIFLYISDCLYEAFGQTVRSLRTERPKPSDFFGVLHFENANLKNKEGRDEWDGDWGDFGDWGGGW